MALKEGMPGQGNSHSLLPAVQVLRSIQAATVTHNGDKDSALLTAGARHSQSRNITPCSASQIVATQTPCDRESKARLLPVPHAPAGRAPPTLWVPASRPLSLGRQAQTVPNAIQPELECLLGYRPS